MKKICEEDLRQVVWLSCPLLSKDGKEALYIRAESDYKTGKNRPVLMQMPVRGGEAKPVSSLTQMQALPRFSEDGTKLAFLGRDGLFPQLWLMDWTTKTERQLTHFRWGVQDYAWSPDGKSLVVEAKRVRAAEENPLSEMTAEEYARYRWQLDHGPRMTERLMYKLDEAYGFLEDAAQQLYQVDAATGEAQMLTDGAFDCFLPGVSLDGRGVYFYARKECREGSLRAVLYRWRGGRMEQLSTAHTLAPVMPVFERDGGFVYAGISQERGRTELFLRLPDGAEIALLPDDGMEGIDPAVIGDDRNGTMGAPAALGDDGSLCYLTAHNGKTFLSQNGQKLSADGCIQGFSAPCQGRLLYLKSFPDHPGELYCRDLNTGVDIRLTHENDWMDAYAMARPCPVTVPAEDDMTVHGYVLLPEGNDACPAVLYVHGGPECFFVDDMFFFEAQSLRAAGFAVLWCNPRGSAGYGPAFAEGKYAYGDAAVNDLTGFVDACAARYPRIDVSRLGVTGGSYGGYMTNKLTLVTDRFRAAAAQRTWIDPATSYDTGDMGFISGSGQTDFRTYMLNRAKGSILKDINKLTAPTLILHGEKDVRCGVEQADQLFNAIRATRPEVPCRLVIFPGENHNITREGLMHNRIRHMLEIRQWMEKYLKEERP